MDGGGRFVAGEAAAAGAGASEAVLFCTFARSIWPHWAGGRLLPERNDPGQASLRIDARSAS